jgi:hypothetical protein
MTYRGVQNNIPCCTLLGRPVNATFAVIRGRRGLHDAHRYANFARNICVTYAPDTPVRITSANPTQMLRAPAARGARNKGCYFLTPLFVAPLTVSVVF